VPVISLKDNSLLNPLGEHVFAKVVAINVYGFSIESEPGNGA